MPQDHAYRAEARGPYLRTVRGRRAEQRARTRLGRKYPEEFAALLPPGPYESRRTYKRMRYAALVALSKEHPEEYEVLRAEELNRVTAEEEGAQLDEGEEITALPTAETVATLIEHKHVETSLPRDWELADEREGETSNAALGSPSSHALTNPSQGAAPAGRQNPPTH